MDRQKSVAAYLNDELARLSNFSGDLSEKDCERFMYHVEIFVDICQSYLDLVSLSDLALLIAHARDVRERYPKNAVIAQRLALAAALYCIIARRHLKNSDAEKSEHKEAEENRKFLLKLCNELEGRNLITVRRTIEENKLDIPIPLPGKYFVAAYSWLGFDRLHISGEILMKGLGPGIVEIPDEVVGIGERACRTSNMHYIWPERLTRIAYKAFDRGSLVAASLPLSVKQIGSKAFSRNLKLNTVIYPSGMTEIPECAFSETGLETVIIPDSVTRIGAAAFYECKNLKNIYLSANLQAIGHNAFYLNSSLEKIQIPEGVTYLGDSAFYGCANLHKVNLPTGLRAIEALTFFHCAITHIDIPDSVISIGEGAFANCNLVYLRLPSEIKEIGDYSFFENNFDAVRIPDSTVSIGAKAFAGCHNLQKVILPASLKHIGEKAFLGCPLKEVAIPESVESFPDNAFDDGVIISR